MSALTPLEIASSPVLYAQDAERAITGCLFHSDAMAKEITSELSEDDFFLGSARRCFRVCKLLVARNEPVDYITCDAELNKLYPASEANETMSFVVTCGTLGAWNLKQYLKIFKEAAVRRKLIDIGDRLAQMAMDVTEDVEVTMDTIRAELRNMVVTKSKWLSMMDVLLASYDWLEAKTLGKIRSMCTGVGDIDRATGGMFPGEMTIIGARPSVGKTAFGLQLAMSAAYSGANTCFVSVEMSPEQMGNRILAREGDVDGTKLRNAVLNDNDWLLITDAMSRCASLPISFLHGASTIETLRKEIQRKVDLNECDLVIIDYLQLLQTKRRFEKEHERLGYISRTCKQMSLEFKIPVIVLAQVKRQNNAGRSRCPVLDELRGSGDMEQDADNVIFLHRPDDDTDPTIDNRDRPYFYNLKQAGFDYMVFNVAKQRQGQVGYLGAAFNPAKMRYVDLDRLREAPAQPALPENEDDCDE